MTIRRVQDEHVVAVPPAGVQAGRRPTLRSVAMPAEHGGWGLTLEPGILGVLLAPSVAGALLASVALLAFLLRTPLRLLLIGRHRGSLRPRTTLGAERQRLAARIASTELVVIAIAVVVAALLAREPLWWLPAVLSAPLFALALWYDMRSRSRHLIPEVAGSVAIASVAAMGALAGGAGWPLALGAWLILGARICSSIPHVRAQVRRIHGERPDPLETMVGDVAAIAIALVAVALERSLVAGAVAIGSLVVVQRMTLLRPPRPARVLGVRQMVLGFGVVGLTALGAWLL